MKINMQTLALVVILLLILVPTGAVVANHVLFDHYSVLTGEGCAAYSIAMLGGEKEDRAVPTPSNTDCPCKGSKREKTGDGLSTFPCRCGQNCPCSVGAAPKVAAPTQVNLLVFGAKWCGPCRQMEESTDVALKAKGWTFGNGKNIQIIDVDLDPVTTRQYAVTVLPCVIRLENGRETKRYEGYVNAGAMGRVWKGEKLTTGDRMYSTR